LGTVKGGATIRSPLIFAISSAKSLIALARSSSVDVLSITMAEAPVIAKSSVSSAIFFPNASLCRVPQKHPGKKCSKGFKRQFGTIWFVIFIFLVSFYISFGASQYRSFWCASWLP
jgi:hypothetical protein